MSSNYSKSFARVNDPLTLLVLNIFLETFRNIESYYTGEGTAEERLEGKRGIRWIRNMEGNFKILAIASGMSIEKFHGLCLEKINEIKRKAYEKRVLEKENRKRKIS